MRITPKTGKGSLPAVLKFFAWADDNHMPLAGANLIISFYFCILKKTNNNIMPKVTFDYNLKKDAWSWVLIAKDKNCWGYDWRPQVAHIPDDLLKEILKFSFPKAQRIVERHLKKHSDNRYRKLVIMETLKTLGNVWQTVERDFFGVLAMMTQKPIYAKNFRCFLTTGFMCPYDQEGDWFMASFWHSIPSSLTTICHELLHFQFLYYYKEYLVKNGLKEAQIEDLKEALTFLLNESEFEKIIIVKDDGYPNHQKLRKKLKRIWDKEKDFGRFIDKAIKVVKKKKY